MVLTYYVRGVLFTVKCAYRCCLVTSLALFVAKSVCRADTCTVFDWNERSFVGVWFRINVSLFCLYHSESLLGFEFRLKY